MNDINILCDSLSRPPTWHLASSLKPTHLTMPLNNRVNRIKLISQFCISEKFGEFSRKIVLLNSIGIYFEICSLSVKSFWNPATQTPWGLFHKRSIRSTPHQISAQPFIWAHFTLIYNIRKLEEVKMWTNISFGILSDHIYDPNHSHIRRPPLN